MGCLHSVELTSAERFRSGIVELESALHALEKCQAQLKLTNGQDKDSSLSTPGPSLVEATESLSLFLESYKAATRVLYVRANQLQEACEEYEKEQRLRQHKRSARPQKNEPSRPSSDPTIHSAKTLLALASFSSPTINYDDQKRARTLQLAEKLSIDSKLPETALRDFLMALQREINSNSKKNKWTSSLVVAGVVVVVLICVDLLASGGGGGLIASAWHHGSAALHGTGSSATTTAATSTTSTTAASSTAATASATTNAGTSTATAAATGTSSSTTAVATSAAGSSVTSMALGASVAAAVQRLLVQETIDAMIQFLKNAFQQAINSSLQNEQEQQLQQQQPEVLVACQQHGLEATRHAQRAADQIKEAHGVLLQKAQSIVEEHGQPHSQEQTFAAATLLDYTNEWKAAQHWKHPPDFLLPPTKLERS